VRVSKFLSVVSVSLSFHSQNKRRSAWQDFQPLPTILFYIGFACTISFSSAAQHCVKRGKDWL